MSYLEGVSADQQATLQGVVSINPRIMGGTPCFAGTRVPIQTLLDYLEDGDSIDDFLTDFVSVKRHQAVQFLEMAKERLIECVSSSTSV